MIDIEAHELQYHQGQVAHLMIENIDNSFLVFNILGDIKRHRKIAIWLMSHGIEAYYDAKSETVNRAGRVVVRLHPIPGFIREMAKRWCKENNTRCEINHGRN